MNLGFRPHTRRSSSTRSFRSPAVAYSRCTRIGSARICPIFMRGLSELNGSWKMTWIFWRKVLSPSPDIAARSSPWYRMLPAVGSSSRSRQRPMVVFPHPDSPTSPRVSPRWISKLTSSTALTSATTRLMRRPSRTGKYFRSPRTETSVSEEAPGAAALPAPLPTVAGVALTRPPPRARRSGSRPRRGPSRPTRRARGADGTRRTPAP